MNFTAKAIAIGSVSLIALGADAVAIAKARVLVQNIAEARSLQRSLDVIATRQHDYRDTWLLDDGYHDVVAGDHAASDQDILYLLLDSRADWQTAVQPWMDAIKTSPVPATLWVSLLDGTPKDDVRKLLEKSGVSFRVSVVKDKERFTRIAAIRRTPAAMVVKQGREIRGVYIGIPPIGSESAAALQALSQGSNVLIRRFPGSRPLTAGFE